AGFGGACVALCQQGRAGAIGREVVAQFNHRGRQGRRARLLMPVPRVEP
ncbi:MAG: hypothetical protein H7Z39_05825, partial [Burkholderiaceae bacterium]|nr:hypothetical protein [Burkholderiaceae bacterium]